MANFSDFLQGLKELFTGKEGQFKQVNRFQQPQLDVLNNILAMLSGGPTTGNFGNSPFAQSFTRSQQFTPFNFEPIAQETRKNFATQTVPLLSERLGGFAGSGTARSSALTGALSSAGAGLENMLASQKAKYDFANQGLQNSSNLNQFNQSMEALKLGLAPQFESSYFPGSQGLIQQSGGIAGQLLPLLPFLL